MIGITFKKVNIILVLTIPEKYTVSAIKLVLAGTSLKYTKQMLCCTGYTEHISSVSADISVLIGTIKNKIKNVIICIYLF